MHCTGFTDYAFTYDALKRLQDRYNYYFRQTYSYRSYTKGSKTYTTTQPASISYSADSSAAAFQFFSLNYGYTNDGNLSSVTGTGRADLNASYTYDDLGQLTGETNSSGSFTYTYDSCGNIRFSTDGTTTHSYTYGDSSWADLLTAYDGHSITYDEIGNPDSWHNSTGDWSLTWSNGRQLTGASESGQSISYTYDLAGIRDSKTINGVTWSYITQNGQVVRQTWGSNTLDIIYDNNGSPYCLKYNGTPYYYVLNLQGDVIEIVEQDGIVMASYTYDACGNILSSTGSLAAINPIRYRGYYYDSETGLYYLGSRYYDPAVKRFINADSANLITSNPYKTENRPLSYPVLGEDL